MTDTGDFDGLAYHKERLRILVWSGFFNEADWETEAEDLRYDPDAEPHIDQLDEFVRAQMAAKREAETSWPAITDWDRLNAEFEAFTASGILALHNAGYTRQDAHSDAWEIIQSDGAGTWRGFVYYHGQDVEGAVEGHPLYLGFDAVEEDAAAKHAIGREIVEVLRTAGFTVEWNNDAETRPHIMGLDWKKRTDWAAALGDNASDPAQAKLGFFARLFGRG